MSRLVNFRLLSNISYDPRWTIIQTLAIVLVSWTANFYFLAKIGYATRQMLSGTEPSSF